MSFLTIMSSVNNFTNKSDDSYLTILILQRFNSLIAEFNDIQMFIFIASRAGFLWDQQMKCTDSACIRKS